MFRYINKEIKSKAAVLYMCMSNELVGRFSYVFLLKIFNILKRDNITFGYLAEYSEDAQE